MHDRADTRCDAEFISEWPPPPAAAAEDADAQPLKQAKLLNSYGESDDCGSSSDDSAVDADAEAAAAVALAKFWRQSASQRHAAAGPSGLSSSSRIAHIARSAAGRTFLEQRVSKLERLVARPSPRQAALLHALASALDYLGDIPRAAAACARAVTLAPHKRSYEWLHLKLRRHAAAQAAARAAWPAACPVGCRFRAVPRLHCSQLSTRRFFEEFAMMQRPVIITGLQVTSEAWSLDVVERAAANMRVDVKWVRRDSCEWAGLEVERSTTVAEFISGLRSSGDDAARCSERGYLFDWSLPQVRAHTRPRSRCCATSCSATNKHFFKQFCNFAVLPRPCVPAHYSPILRP